MPIINKLFLNILYHIVVFFSPCLLFTLWNKLDNLINNQNIKTADIPFSLMIKQLHTLFIIFLIVFIIIFVLSRFLGKWMFIITGVVVMVFLVHYLTRVFGGDDMYMLGFYIFYLPVYFAAFAYSIGFGAYYKWLKVFLS